MPPREQAEIPQLDYSTLFARAKNQRSEVRTALSTPFSKISLVKTEHGCRVFALGTTCQSTNQTLLSAEFSPETVVSQVVLQPLFNSDQYSRQASQELALMCERQRATIVNGVTDYTLHTGSTDLVASTGDRLFRYKNGELTAVNWEVANNIARKDENSMELEEKSSPKAPAVNFVSEAKICPCDGSITAFVLNKQVCLERHGTTFYRTSSVEGVTNGVSSFIAQEELERFEAVWWSEKFTRLIYEQVDERSVPFFEFTCPGKVSAGAMRYPQACGPNATSSIRMLILHGDEVIDVPLKYSLKTVYPEYEYLTRAGFAKDGKTVWVQLMNRTQSECRLVLIPEHEFDLPERLIEQNDADLDARRAAVNNGCIPSTSGVKKVTTVHSDSLKDYAWVNTHNSTIPILAPNYPPGYHFIYSREMPKGSILVVASVVVDEKGYGTRFETPLMSADHSICKSTKAEVDEKRQLVYYVANQSNPTEWNVCVASFASRDTINSKRLTEMGISFRNERSAQSLAIDVNVGFVCFMTSYDTPQVCKFYRLQHSNDVLPTAIFAAQVVLPGSSMSHNLTLPHPEAPEIISYESENTGYTHYALVMKPSNFDESKKYPVVHYVYGGPGIQVVRNDYSVWFPFTKYTRMGYFVVMLDGRGSANRGIDFEKPIRAKLGAPEAVDQVEGLREISQRYVNMDMERVVVTGWSYGGFMSLMMIANYPTVYRAAVAGGAVTNWRLYDTAYTERYLGYPALSSYENSSVLPFVDDLPDECGRLMIIHGLLDENVHFTHAENLIESMIRKGKPYELKLFPSERHGIRNPDSAAYLDAAVLDFMARAVALPKPIQPHNLNIHKNNDNSADNK